MRSGTYSRLPTLPYTPGLDSAGIITKLGRNVDKFKVNYFILINTKTFIFGKNLFKRQ